MNLLNSKKRWMALFIIICCLPFILIACGDDDDDIEPPPLPGIPTGLKAEVRGDAIVLTWQASVNSVRYIIYRASQQNGNPTYVTLATIDKTTYTDTTNLKPETTYLYKVAGVSAKGKDGREIFNESPPISVRFDPATLTVAPKEIDFGDSTMSLPLKLINAGGERLEWEIKMEVREPKLSVSSPSGAPLRSVDFGTIETTKEIQIRNAGTGLMTWNIEDRAVWLTVTPLSGDTRTEIDTVRLTVNRAGLQPGPQSTSIVINAGDAGRETVTIAMKVPQPELTLSPNTLVFNPGETQKSIQVENTGEGTLVWNADVKNASWVKVLPSNGSTPEGRPTPVRIEVDDISLDAGIRTAIVTFNSTNGGAKELRIQLTKVGQITGIVRNLFTNVPIPNATVAIPTREARTGPDGRFTLQYDKEGEYPLKITASSTIDRQERVKTARGRGEIEVWLTPIARQSRVIQDTVKLRTPRRIAFREQRAYTTSDIDNSVAVINTATHQVITKIPLKCEAVLCDPTGIAANPRRAQVYVTIPAADQVSVINTEKNEEVRQIPVGNSPIARAVSPDGRTLYVSNQLDNNLSGVDLDTLRVRDRIPVGCAPAGMAISPDGVYLYVSNKEIHTVSVVDLKAGAETTKIAVGSNPDAIAIAENGQYAYVVNTGSNDLSIIDISTKREVARIPDLSAFTLIGVAAVREGGAGGREIAYTVDNDGTLSVVEMPSKTVQDIGVRAGGGEIRVLHL